MRTARLAATIVLVSVALVVGAVPAAAHASLMSSDPADGATVADVRVVTAVFNEALDREKSRLELRDAGGSTVAEGGVVTADATALTMQVEVLALLEPGAYEVRWTAVTPDDGAVERGSFAFTVVAAASASPEAPASVVPSASPAVPSASPAVPSSPASVAPSAAASVAASISPSAAPSAPSGTSVAPSGAPSAAPSVPPTAAPSASPTPAPSASPTPAPSASTGSGSGGTDVLIPVIVVLAAAVIVGGALFLRRRPSA